MAAADIALKAKAKRLLEAGHEEFDGYRKMSTDKLTKLIASATGTKGKSSGGTKGRASANGSKGRARSTSVVKGRGAKGAKGRAKSAPAVKSTSRKTTPAKGKATAAKGKAKRPTTGAKGKTTTPKRAPARRGAVAFANIDNKAVDWKVESNVGRTGKRKTVLDALRAAKGNKDKAFNACKRYATKWYPGKSKDDADKMVRWLVGRVAYDYVMNTDQHTPGQRADYGTSDRPQDVRRRELRGASKPKRSRSASKSTPKRSAAQKGTQSRARTAPKGKGKAKGRKGR